MTTFPDSDALTHEPGIAAVSNPSDTFSVLPSSNLSFGMTIRVSTETLRASIASAACIAVAAEQQESGSNMQDVMA